MLAGQTSTHLLHQTLGAAQPAAHQHDTSCGWMAAAMAPAAAAAAAAAAAGGVYCQHQRTLNLKLITGSAARLAVAAVSLSRMLSWLSTLWPKG